MRSSNGKRRNIASTNLITSHSLQLLTPAYFRELFCNYSAERVKMKGQAEKIALLVTVPIGNDNFQLAATCVSRPS
jgi:hypothetical protein